MMVSWASKQKKIAVAWDLIFHGGPENLSRTNDGLPANSLYSKPHTRYT
jgi:hypothetical protein